MGKQMDELLEEPIASANTTFTTDTLLASIAISTKRIADALEGNLSAGGFANLEQLAWAMGRSFENGRGAA
jgi:hypothetical protein